MGKQEKRRKQRKRKKQRKKTWERKKKAGSGKQTFFFKSVCV